MRITDLPLGAQDVVAKQADFATFSRFKRAVLREACCQDVAERRAVMSLLVTLWLGVQGGRWGQRPWRLLKQNSGKTAKSMKNYGGYSMCAPRCGFYCF